MEMADDGRAPPPVLFVAVDEVCPSRGIEFGNSQFGGDGSEERYASPLACVALLYEAGQLMTVKWRTSRIGQDPTRMGQRPTDSVRAPKSAPSLVARFLGGASLPRISPGDAAGPSENHTTGKRKPRDPRIGRCPPAPRRPATIPRRGGGSRVERLRIWSMMYKGASRMPTVGGESDMGGRSPHLVMAQ